MLGPWRERGAGRDVGRRGQLGRRRASGGAGLRRGRRHHEAVLLRRLECPTGPAARSTRSTMRATWPTRWASRTTSSISRIGSTSMSSRTSSASTAAGGPRSLRSLQLIHQVPRPAGPCRRAGLRLHRHGALRGGPRRRPVPGPGPQQGPELLPVGNRPPGSGPDAHTGRLAHQGGDARLRARGWGSPRRTRPNRWRSASFPTTTMPAFWSATCPRTPPPWRPVRS